MVYSNECYIYSNSEATQCEKLQEFINQITTPKKHNSILNKKEYDESSQTSLDESQILNYVNQQMFSDCLKYKVLTYHDCIGFSFTDLRFDVIVFLCNNDYLTIYDSDNNQDEKESDYISVADLKSNYNVIELLCELFSDYNTTYGFLERNTKYIEYVWNWIEEENPKALVNYVNHSSTLIHSIINSKNTQIKTIYFEKYVKLWDTYYPTREFVSIYVQNETVDGLNVILALCRNFMSTELKYVFSRPNYNSKNYTWYQHHTNNNKTFTVPLISFLLEENSWMCNPTDLEKFAEIIDVLITYGKFNYDLQVIETGHTMGDYLEHYGYNYFGSCIMDTIFKHEEPCSSTNQSFPKFYIPDENIPYSTIQCKHEYLKNTHFGKNIMKEINEEYERTGVNFDTFLQTSGFIHLIK
jgi:hypothetical protein